MSQLGHEEQNIQRLAYSDYSQGSESVQSTWSGEREPAPSPDHNNHIANYVQRQRGTVYILLNAVRNLGRESDWSLHPSLLLLFGVGDYLCYGFKAGLEQGR